MSKTQETPAMRGRNELEASERPMLVLERQLMDTLTLDWLVEQVRVQLSEVNALLLIDGMADELKTFIRQIQRRLERWPTAKSLVAESGAPYWCLFATEGCEPEEQFRGLLSGYVHYEKRTHEAIACLRLSGDCESVELLQGISTAIERRLCVLEIYLEGMALRRAATRVPVLLPEHRNGRC